MGCKAKYVPIRVRPHHAARVNLRATGESERVGCQSREVTTGPDKWQRDPRASGDIQNPAYRTDGQVLTGAARVNRAAPSLFTFFSTFGNR